MWPTILNLPMASSFAARKAILVAGKRLPLSGFFVHPPCGVKYSSVSLFSISIFESDILRVYLVFPRFCPDSSLEFRSARIAASRVSTFCWVFFSSARFSSVALISASRSRLASGSGIWRLGQSQLALTDENRFNRFWMPQAFRLLETDQRIFIVVPFEEFASPAEPTF